jgi:hypothetical protein
VLLNKQAVCSRFPITIQPPEAQCLLKGNDDNMVSNPTKKLNCNDDFGT